MQRSIDKSNLLQQLQNSNNKNLLQDIQNE
uniref:Uncharacterized protein n=1 Tax=Rhizophora mucronata TaxID=61149 RepID=A0A2P2QVK0_RHIMU